MRTSKDIYEALNDVEFNIEDYERETLSDLEKKRIKKNFMKSRRKTYDPKKLGTIAVALVLVVGIFSQTNFSRFEFTADGKELRAETNKVPLDYSFLVEFDTGSRSIADVVELKRSRHSGDLNSEVTWITLAPYVKEFPEEEGMPYEEEWTQIGEAFTINLI